jgi:hypothetical protein
MPGLFVEMGVSHFLPGLVLKCDLPDICLPSSWDYSNEPPCPTMFFLKNLLLHILFYIIILFYVLTVQRGFVVIFM